MVVTMKTMKNILRRHFLGLPSATINEASYECHEELPRWSKIGVDTCPFRLCILGWSFGPERILRLLLSS